MVTNKKANEVDYCGEKELFGSAQFALPASVKKHTGCLPELKTSKSEKYKIIRIEKERKAWKLNHEASKYLLIELDVANDLILPRRTIIEYAK